MAEIEGYCGKVRETQRAEQREVSREVETEIERCGVVCELPRYEVWMP